MVPWQQLGKVTGVTFVKFVAVLLVFCTAILRGKHAPTPQWQSKKKPSIPPIDTAYISMSHVRGSVNHGAIPTAVSTDERHSSHTVQNQVPRHSGSGSIDGPEDTFHRYLAKEAEKVKKGESQREDANEVLIFAALLAATVATLIGASIRGLQLDPLDKWAFYLVKTYELLVVDPKEEPRDFFPSSTLIDPSEFTPENSVILINSLWFLSMSVCLTCIMLASLLQHWANQYNSNIFTRPRTDPRDPAEPRSPFGAGGEELRLPWLVEALPAMLRMSLLLFFAGFGVFVFNLTADFGTAEALLLTAGSLICPLLCFLHT